MKTKTSEALKKALTAERIMMPVETAVRVTEVVLRTVREELQRDEPYAKTAITSLEEAESTLDDINSDEDGKNDEGGSDDEAQGPG